MRKVASETKDFLRAELVFLVIGIAVIIATEKSDLHLWFNQWHHPLADVFFQYATRLAEGLFVGIVIFYAFVRKIRYGVAAGVAVALSSLTTQLLKHMVFPDYHRPYKFFANLADLHLVDGVKMHSHFSFPSGHSTSAFTIFFILGFILESRTAERVCFALALLVAFSRVYLSQHFFEDIYVGSIVGTGTAFLVFSVLHHRSWGEKGLLSRFDH